MLADIMTKYNGTPSMAFGLKNLLHFVSAYHLIYNVDSLLTINKNVIISQQPVDNTNKNR